MKSETGGAICRKEFHEIRDRQGLNAIHLHASVSVETVKL